ncbi:hypothetical protein HZU77_016600, partial [Neisseriaceae bacterium TC5R-5]|nr:hypothetical protein [Neisseriaceae bacterium TC5R-5]
MVAIVSGAGLGLTNGSLTQLGALGQFGTAGVGRGNEQVYLNAANGNLVLQQRDEFLKSAGVDLGVLRTYNSQGQTNDNPAWRLGVSRQIGSLQGTLNSAGSSVLRTGEDGQQVRYTFDTSRNAYIARDGAGADDVLHFDSSRQQWHWTDGASQNRETYDANGRLLQLLDRDGQTLSLSYNAAGLVTQLLSSSGEALLISYDVKNNITQLTTQWSENGVTRTQSRVRYSYDSLNRLSSVSVDLTPEDGSISDGNSYTTRYTYDGNSSRLASLSQSDGSRLEFSYQSVGDDWRISEIRDIERDGSLRRTRLSYDVATQTTTLTDAAGSVSQWRYDGNGQLLSLSIDGQTQFSASYDAQGRVLQVTDARGQRTDYEYDAHGNLVLERNAAGQTLLRRYNAQNQLISETRYRVADPDGAGSAQPTEPDTTRYIYDASGLHLRYKISADGRVSEWRVDSQGRPVSQIHYLALATGLSANPSESELNAWVAKQDLTQTQRSDNEYDLRGLLSRLTRYSHTDRQGVGIQDGTQQSLQYIYDQNGLLLQSIDSLGGQTRYRYDGLNRLTQSTDALGNSTTTVYLDAKGQTQVTLANGLTTLQQYDSAGHLISLSRQDAGGPLGTTRYQYDALGRLLRSTDPTGQQQTYLYDAQGRQIAEIDASGALTETRYNAAGQIIRRIRYATLIPASALSTELSLLTLDSLRPAASADDRHSYQIIDAAGQLLR